MLTGDAGWVGKWRGRGRFCEYVQNKVLLFVNLLRFTVKYPVDFLEEVCYNITT